MNPKTNEQLSNMEVNQNKGDKTLKVVILKTQNFPFPILTYIQNLVHRFI